MKQRRDGAWFIPHATLWISILGLMASLPAAALDVNDPLFPQQWTLNNRGLNGAATNADVNAPAAWTNATGNPGIVIAVLDSGIPLGDPA